MRDLLDQLLAAQEQRRACAYCRLVETRGSTPQKAGATMLVYADGSQQGTLGGGCVEAEVKRRALAAMNAAAAELTKFQLDSDYGWDDGLICGGRMQVLIQPLVGDDILAYYRTFHRLASAGQGVTEAIVYDEQAAGLPKSASFLFDGENRLVATLRGGTDENDNGQANKTARDSAAAKVSQSLRPLASRPRPYAAAGVAYLTLLPRCRLVIVGGGHVGKAVADLAADLDFDVCVVDDRESIVAAERFPRAQQRISGRIGQVLPELEITPSTYCLIVTRGHNHDEEALYHLAGRGAAYVGMIGSRRKIRLIFDDLLAERIDPQALEQVHAPVGLDIGSQTVPEIAISICAELIAHRNQARVVAVKVESGNNCLGRSE